MCRGGRRWSHSKGQRRHLFGNLPLSTNESAGVDVKNLSRMTFNGFFKAGVEDWKIENSSQFTAPACPLPAGDVPLPHPLRLHRSPVASASISPYHQTDWRTGVFAVAENQVIQPTMLPNRIDRHSSTISDYIPMFSWYQT